MPSIVYLHGFLSSPLSNKAQLTKAWIEKHYPGFNYFCPDLPSSPPDAKQCLLEFFDNLDSNVFLIGSSLGGFWATWLVENNLAARAVLINPAVAPHTRFREFLGQTLQHYYKDEFYSPTEAHLAVLASMETPVTRDERYWLMVQQADEVLDYEQAVKKYAGCKQLVEPGGDHSFVGYERYLPAIMDFFLNNVEND